MREIECPKCPINPPDFCKDKSEPLLYEARLKEWRDNKSRIDGARVDGMQEVFALWQSGLSFEDAQKKLGI